MSCDCSTAQLPDPLPDELTYVADAVMASTLRGRDRDNALLRRLVGAAHAWRGPRVGGSPARLRDGHICALVGRYRPDLTTGGRCMFVRGLLNEVADRDFTEGGLAHRVVERHGADLAWSTATGWRVWSGSHWRHDDGLHVRHLVAQYVETELARDVRVLREMAAETAGKLDGLGDGATDDTKREIKARAEDAARAAKSAAAFAQRAQTALAVRHVVELAQAIPGVAVREERWDDSPEVLGVADGTVELHPERGAQAPRPPRRSDRLTQATRAKARPWSDGTATGTDWARFVRAAFPDPDVRAFVQRHLGYSLLGDNRERIVVVLLGGTSTGKSTLMAAVQHALGDYAGPFELTLLRTKREEGPRADMVRALSRRFVGTTEASDQWQLHGDAIKRITGGDVLSARTLHSREIVERRPAFTPWIATNQAPQVVGVDEALWRRLVVIPMGQRVQEEDAALGERLRADPDAVLGWLLDGFNAYAAHGLGEAPAPCRAAADELRADLSPLDAWMAEETVAEPGAEALMSDLAASWFAWTLSNRVRESEQMSTIGLGKALSARGFPVVHRGTKGARVRARLGLRLTDAGEAPLRVVGP